MSKLRNTKLLVIRLAFFSPSTGPSGPVKFERTFYCLNRFNYFSIDWCESIVLKALKLLEFGVLWTFYKLQVALTANHDKDEFEIKPSLSPNR